MGYYVAKPTSRKKIRSLANGLRDILDLNETKCFPVLALLEGILPTVAPGFNYEIVPKSDMPNRLGVTYPEKHLIVIREDVYDNAVAGKPFDRFTIAHEIGHYLMHSGETSLARIDSKEGVPSYCDPEWQANTFAAELLAPPHVISGMKESEIISKCAVSRQVAQIQMKNS